MSCHCFSVISPDLVQLRFGNILIFINDSRFISFFHSHLSYKHAEFITLLVVVQIMPFMPNLWPKQVHLMMVVRMVCYTELIHILHPGFILSTGCRG